MRHRVVVVRRAARACWRRRGSAGRHRTGLL